ncbi:MAG: DMT family transporter [Desulfobacteraceae bacterium]|nr:DMT family transporter [Desulfobacteraceae bacterium]
MYWQSMALLSGFFYAVSIILRKIVLQDNQSDPYSCAVVFHFLSGVLAVGLALILGQDIFFLPDLSLTLMFHLVSIIFLFSLGVVLVFISMKYIEASEFAIIYTSRVFFTIIASFVFLDEVLMPIQFIGTLFIVAGIVMINIRRENFFFPRPTILAIAAAICIGFSATYARYLLGFVNPYQFNIFMLLGSSILLFLVKVSSAKHFKYFSRIEMIFKMLALSLVYTFMNITFYLAMESCENSSQVMSLFMSGLIMSIVLSIIFLKEIENIKIKFLAAIISFIGVLFLI